MTLADTWASEAAHGTTPAAAIWQEVEWGHYRADLEVWERLVPAGAAVLELGCGAGRVALRLAGRGRSVMGVDTDRELIAHLRRVAREARLDVRAEVADTLALSLDQRFGVIIAPLQLVNILAPDERHLLLANAAAHLDPDGILAMSVISQSDLVLALGQKPADAGILPDGSPTAGGWPISRTLDVLPDVRQEAGWVYASRPVRLELAAEVVDVHSLRETVSPTGEHEQRTHVDRFNLVDADILVEEAAGAGLREVERLAVEPTPADAGATIVVFELGDRPGTARGAGA